MIIYVYCLLDPVTEDVRYIGITNNANRRLRDHNSQCYKYSHRCANWIKKLHKLNLCPIMDIIDECDETNWKEKEKYWIKTYREMDCDLTNLTDGGEGSWGRILSLDARKRIGEASKSRNSGSGNPMYGSNRSGESNPNYGNHHSEESKNKISLANRGNKYRLGRKLSDETKRKISQSVKDWHLNNKR